MAKPKSISAVRELTLSSITIGILTGVVMTAANVYLGLYVGMTVSASIPAAVIGMAIYRGLLGRKDAILEANIVQTMASAGETLAAGVIFTLPALVLVGAWKEFRFWPVTLIAMGGGVLGVVMLVPLRKAMIIDRPDLKFPEGVACATVLEAGSADHSDGIRNILKGFFIGGLFKFLTAGLGVLKGTLEYAGKIGERVWFMGSDISPALLGVGYIIGLEASVLVFLGGAIGGLLATPWLGIPTGMETQSAVDIAWELWSSRVRYFGVGTMVVGGLYSILQVRKGIFAGFSTLKTLSKKQDARVAREDRNLSLAALGVIFTICIAVLFSFYDSLLGSVKLASLAVVIMTVLSFFVVAVGAYVCGLVGSSNSPTSGITISALLAIAAVLLVFGVKGDSAILATLSIAAVVCCATSVAGDCCQDLKTGQIVGATPKNQQIAEMIGVLIPGLVLAPTLSLLHSTYVIGVGLRAPQATLFASLTQGIFGGTAIPLGTVYAGMAFGVFVIAVDEFLLRPAKAAFRLHIMPLAVGIYLPVTVSVPVLIGGCLSRLAEKLRAKRKGPVESDSGVLLSSGIIAGESIFGIIVALFLYFKWDIVVKGLSSHIMEGLTIGACLLLIYYMARQVMRPASSKK